MKQGFTLGCMNYTKKSSHASKNVTVYVLIRACA